MPHYANGQEAKVGDVVIGKGYNVSHIIIGKVVNVRPGDSCTLSVAHVDAQSLLYFAGDPAQPFAQCHVQPSIEYGDTRSFSPMSDEVTWSDGKNELPRA